MDFLLTTENCPVGFMSKRKQIRTAGRLALRVELYQGRRASIGSGMFLSSEGYFLSSYHVFSKCYDNGSVKYYDPTQKKNAKAEIRGIEHKDERLDLIVARCDISSQFSDFLSQQQAIGLGYQELPDKSPVRVYSFLKDYCEKRPGRIKEFNFSKKTSNLMNFMSLSDCYIVGGCSGSPVFDMKTGYFAGVTGGTARTKKRFFSRDYHYFVQAKYVAMFLGIH